MGGGRTGRVPAAREDAAREEDVARGRYSACRDDMEEIRRAMMEPWRTKTAYPGPRRWGGARCPSTRARSMFKAGQATMVRSFDRYIAADGGVRLRSCKTSSINNSDCEQCSRDRSSRVSSQHRICAARRLHGLRAMSRYVLKRPLRRRHSEV